MRLGLLGGTFDPVHYGHLILAECCREQCRLDEVWFLPALVPPHKQDRDLSPIEHRLGMLELAIAGHRPFRVCRDEIDRGGVSYTFETLGRLQEKVADGELFLLLGADMFHDLPNWRQPAVICDRATIVGVSRSGGAPQFERLREIATEEQIQRFRQNRVEMPTVDISSTDLRRRVAQGRSIRFLTPRAVEEYIKTHRLYRD